MYGLSCMYVFMHVCHSNMSFQEVNRNSICSFEQINVLLLFDRISTAKIRHVCVKLYLLIALTLFVLTMFMLKKYELIFHLCTKPMLHVAIKMEQRSTCFYHGKIARKLRSLDKLFCNLLDTHKCVHTVHLNPELRSVFLYTVL